jgi:hypothetical protein
MARARWELWLDDPDGTRVMPIRRTVSHEISLVLNDYGAFEVRLPDTFDIRRVRKDCIIEFWRKPAGGVLKLVGTGLVRKPRRQMTQTGKTYYILFGPSENEVLSRHIVAADAGSAAADKTDYADDMMCEIVDEQFGSGAGTGRALESTWNLSIQGDVGAGPSITKAFSRRNVLKVLQDIAAESEQRGYPLYFGLVPRVLSSGKLGFGFRARLNQWGMDRSTESSNPTMLGTAFDNVTEPVYTEDATEEANYVYVGGGGLETERVITEVSDSVAIGASPINRREIFVDARTSADGALEGIGKAALAEHAVKKTFTCRIKDTRKARYGIDWEFGDKVTVGAFGMEFTGLVRAVRAGVTVGGEDFVLSKMST